MSYPYILKQAPQIKHVYFPFINFQFKCHLSINVLYGCHFINQVISLPVSQDKPVR
jgi:hypothetical protein